LKKRSLTLLPVTLFIFCVLTQKVYCQESYDLTNTPRQFYYNNFQGATVSSPATFFSACASSSSTSASIYLTTNSSINSSKSLSTVGSSTLGTLTWNFFNNAATGANISLNNAPYEWEFDYKNTTGGATVDPDGPSGMVAGSDSWRYWLITSLSSSNTKLGIYVTQVNGNLEMRQKYDNSAQYRPLFSVPMPNSTDTYQIRIVRSVTGYFNIYVLNRTTGVTTSKLLLNGNYDSAYNLSYLEATSTNPDRFQWDNFNFYRVKLDYACIAPTSANGITTNIYPGIVNAVPYAVNVNVRGDVPIGRFVINFSGNASNLGQSLFTKGAIYKTSGNVFNIANGTKLSDVNVNGVNTQQTDFSSLTPPEYYYNGGNTDGTLANVMNYFFVAQGRSPFYSGYPTSISYSVSATGDDNYTQFFNTTSPYTSGSSNSALFSVSSSAPGPTVAAVSPLCGSGVASIKASGGTPTGGTYDWYTATTGGVLLQSSASDTYTPFLGGTTTFYVAYTANGVTSPRTSVTVTVNPKVTTPLSSAVVSYPFNNSYADVSGNGNNLLSYGATAPTPVADRNGTPNSAYNFSGNNQYFSTSLTNYDPQVYSLSLWFRTTSTQGGKLIGFVQSSTPGESGQFDRHIYMNTAGYLYFGVYTGGTKIIKSAKTYNDGIWHHVVVTVAPANAATPLVAGGVMYVDGVTAGTNTAITGGEPHNGYWRIGGDDLSNWTDVSTGKLSCFNGDIDDVGVYYRALTAAEATGSNDINIIGNSAAFCQNNSIMLTAPNITGATYNWVDNANNANVATGNPATFPNASSGTYTLNVSVNGCPSSATITLASPTYTWTGAAGTTAINTAANWTHTSTGEVGFIAPPFAGTETIIISPAATTFPVLTANLNVYTLNIGNGASISLNGNTLNVGCNIYNNNTTAGGILYGTSSTANTTSSLTWGGNVLSQNYIGAATTTPAQIGKMTVNNTNTSTGTVNIISGSINVYNLLTMTKGKLAVATPAKLTLKSTSTLTASVPALGTGTSITGNVTVERWFTGGSASNRGWRLMSMPVNNTGDSPVLSTSKFNFSSLQTNLYITGTGTNFDATAGPTILFYNTDTKLFTYPTDPTTNSAANKVGAGFYFYFRGDKSSSTGKLSKAGNPLAYATPEANVVGLQTGTLNQRDITYTLSNGGSGYNLIGNPYPSTITIPSEGGSAANTVFTGTTGFVYTYSPGASSISPAATKTINIASGQGFFVKTSSSSTGSYTAAFTESLKTTAQLTGGNLLLGKPVGIEEPLLSIKMIQDSANYDITHLRFLDTYKNEYDQMEDADDLNASGQNTFLSAMTVDNRAVAIASQPLDKKKTSVFLNVNDNYSGLYTIEKMNLSGIPEAYDVWLMDHFKSDSLDLRANDTYKFNLDKNNPLTFGATRFEIVIRKKSLPPYQLVSFNGQKTGTDVLLKWNTVNEYDYTSFELQRSADGTNFEAVRNIQSSSQGAYNFKDIYSSNNTATIYYRLKQVDINDVVYYSNVVIITPAKGNGTFTVFPNPATNTIQFSLDQTLKLTSVRLSIFNTMGLLMKSSNFTAATGQQDVSTLIRVIILLK
jgi:hypothetical protein